MLGIFHKEHWPNKVKNVDSNGSLDLTFPPKWVKGSRPSSQDAWLARSLVAAERHAYAYRSTANIQSTMTIPNAQAAGENHSIWPPWMWASWQGYIGRIRESYHGRKKFSCVYFWYQLLRTGGLYAFLFRLLGVAHLNGYILISQVCLFKAAVPKVAAWSV